MNEQPQRERHRRDADDRPEIALPVHRGIVMLYGSCVDVALGFCVSSFISDMPD
jgi:hypothetical protein